MLPMARFLSGVFVGDVLCLCDNGVFDLGYVAWVALALFRTRSAPNAGLLRLAVGF